MFLKEKESVTTTDSSVDEDDCRGRSWVVVVEESECKSCRKELRRQMVVLAHTVAISRRLLQKGIVSLNYATAPLLAAGAKKVIEIGPVTPNSNRRD